MKNTIILIGGGGHCKSVIDVIESEGKYIIAGIIDNAFKKGEIFFGYSILGGDDDLPELISLFKNFHITIGHIKSNKVRINLFNTVKDLGGEFPIIIASTAYVSVNSKIGIGTIIMHNAFVNASTVIGQNCIINTSTIIEHDSVIGNNSHISTGAIINGNCFVGNNVFIGSRATVIQSISIMDECFVGAGAVVIKDTIRGHLYTGIPAKIK
jgi:sugar O-acyltransferase (sialic acid O-acetyltransferase NeuD family)